MAVSPGDQISHYRIVRRLGAGGMGEVFLAEDTRLGRQVALKFLAPELARSEAAIARFQAEAQAAAGLAHAHIATLYDIAEDEDRKFLVLEYVEGESLDASLQKGPLGVDETARLAADLADGLAHAHQRGIVHRDIKPANVIRTPEGDAKILDLGLARRAEDAHLTAPGTTVGTAAYLSPEQARGEAADPRSDLWSLGVVLYESVTGQLPFQGEALAARIHNILSTEPVAPSHLRPETPDWLEAVVLKCLQKDPADRFQTAAELRDVVNEARGDLSTRTVAIPLSSASRPEGQKRGPVFVGLIALLVVAMGGWWLSTRDENAGTATAEVVRVEDENGEVVERLVPKATFRKHAALFYFETDLPDSSHWMNFALSDLLFMDLVQDPYMEIKMTMHFAERLKSRGLEAAASIPLSLQREIAKEEHVPFFVTGTISGSESAPRIERILHETETGQEVERRVYEGSDLFTLVDQMSRDLRQDLGLPENIIAAQTDVAVSELMTSDWEALEANSMAGVKMLLENDYVSASTLLATAVERDSTFAVAHYTRYLAHLLQNDLETARVAMDGAMDHLYRIPERHRFAIKTSYYINIEMDADKALATTEMWTRLHPGDVTALTQLATLHRLRGDRRAVIGDLKKILELDPDRFDLLQEISQEYQNLGEYADAEVWLNRYAEQYPGEASSFLELCELYEAAGRLDDAESALEKAALLAVRDVDTHLSKARIQRKRGDFDACFKTCDEALDLAESPMERLKVLAEKGLALRRQGRLNEAIESMESLLQEVARALPPLVAVPSTMALTELLAESGRIEEATRVHRESTQLLPPEYRSVTATGKAFVHLRAGEADSASASVAVARQTAKTFGVAQLDDEAVELLGRIAELNGDYEAALAHYDEALRRKPTDTALPRLKARMQRHLERNDAAMVSLERALALAPGNPHNQLEMAFLLRQQGDSTAALEYVQRALSAWESADEGWEPAEQARKLLAQLDSDS